MKFRTDRLLIREYREQDDFKRILEITNHDLVNTHVIWKVPQSPLEVRRLMENYYTVSLLTVDYDVIGFCRIYEESENVYAVGYYLHPLYWGNGYATEITKGLFKNAFCGLCARKVIATCDPRNVNSERVMKRCGMIFEGRVREDKKLPNGQYRDSLYYSILRNEYLHNIET